MTAIRSAKPHDLAEIMRLHRQASELHGRLDPRLASGSEEAEKFRKALQPMLGKRSYPVFVAQKDDGERLGGCVICKVVDNRPFYVPEYGYISCLYVDEGWRQQELGSELFATLYQWLKAEELDVAQVDVSACNTVGRHFWERIGFTNFLDHLYRETDAAIPGAVDSSVVVRGAKVGDLEAVVSLWQEMMDYHAPLDRRLRVLPGGIGYVTQAVRYWLGDSGSCLLVAEAGDTVIGFALGGLVDTGLGLKPARYGHVAHICVTAKWRRRGIGRQLLAAMRGWFQKRGLSSIHIYVSHFSPVSQRFWRKLGFEDYVERLWCDL